MAKLPITDFLISRLKEYDSTFEVRRGTGFEQLFFKPVQYIMQPLVDESELLTTAQSFLRILQLDDPNSFSEEAVDALASNFFVERNPGGQSGGIARVYYADVVGREWPAEGAMFTGNNGLKYTNPAPFIVDSAQVSAQVDGGLYYYDIPAVSVDTGEETLLDIGGIISIDNDSDAISATNLQPFTGGSARETNTALISRVRRSIAVRDLVTGKGFDATMFENFMSFLTELRTIGFGDAEMMRDIVYNTHIGGKVDAYFKTVSILQGYKNFVGVLPDLTRQAHGLTNIQLFNTDATSVPDANFDTTGAKLPMVKQVLPESAAEYLSPVSLVSPVDLSVNSKIKLTFDGTTMEFSLAGAIPASTTRQEIISIINTNFGFTAAYAVGASLKVKTQTKGRASTLTIAPPTYGGSALLSVFGLTSTQTFNGDGPVVFTQDIHYTTNNLYGSIARIVGSVTKALASTGETAISSGRSIFSDATSGAFSAVAVDDIITINPTSPNLPWGDIVDPLQGIQTDFRIISKIDNNTLVIDEVPHFKGTWNAADNLPYLHDGDATEGDIYKVTTAGTANLGSGDITFVIGDYVNYTSGAWAKVAGTTETGISYVVRRTGIKNGETVLVDYYFNPLSIDVGPNVWYTDTSTYPTRQVRGIRPGREEMTITDMVFLRINSIDIIDPVTLEPTGEVLNAGGGFGYGGYGEGGYGSGGGSDYYMVVNSPHERFSVFDDCMIVLSQALIGLSFRVNYDYVPEGVTLHNFVRSESERVLDADTLMKHFYPAYVSGTITYKVDATDSSIPSNDALTASVKKFISAQPAGSDLKISDVYQFLARNTDPNDRYGSYVKPFSLTALIHCADGSTTVISSDDKLVVPTPVPFPKDTTNPLSPRISHWIGDNIVLVRES